MSKVSNGQFWIYTAALIILWIIVLTSAINNESNIEKNFHFSYERAKEEEKGNTQNCTTLCQQCGCLGFYCGEECICECNNENSDTECIAIMRVNAIKMNIPFEILIQGPTENKFVRTAMRFEQNIKRKADSNRPTIRIYKPNKVRQYLGGIVLKKSTVNKNKEPSKSTKRSTDNTFNWFSDSPNNLVRPAPLSVWNNNSNEPKAQLNVPKYIKASSISENSWFLDNRPNNLTPAPLLKRKINKSSIINTVSYEDTNKKTRSYTDEEKFAQQNPIVLDENISDTFVLDNANSEGFKKDSFGNVYVDSLKNKRKHISRGIYTGGFHSRSFDDNSKSRYHLTSKTIKHIPELEFSWLRPINFLEKVKSVIRS